jgi:hypothetical protein
LIKNPNERPNAETLLQHQFIANVNSEAKEEFSVFLKNWIGKKKFR